jgi:hypothetical protein
MCARDAQAAARLLDRPDQSLIVLTTASPAFVLLPGNSFLVLRRGRASRSRSVARLRCPLFLARPSAAVYAPLPGARPPRVRGTAARQRRAPRTRRGSLVGRFSARRLAPMRHPSSAGPQRNRRARDSRATVEPLLPDHRRRRAPRRAATPARRDPRSPIDTLLTSASGGEEEHPGVIAAHSAPPQSGTFTASTVDTYLAPGSHARKRA